MDDALLDRLRELGVERLTLWHLRAVDAYLRHKAMPIYHHQDMTRLLSDLSGEERVWQEATRQNAMRDRAGVELAAGAYAGLTFDAYLSRGRAEVPHLGVQLVSLRAPNIIAHEPCHHARVEDVLMGDGVTTVARCVACGALIAGVAAAPEEPSEPDFDFCGQCGAEFTGFHHCESE